MQQADVSFPKISITNRSCAALLQSLRIYDMDRVPLLPWQFDPNVRLALISLPFLEKGQLEIKEWISDMG